MQIILLGKNGQLGWELQRTLATLGEVIALDFPEIDLAKTQDLCRLIRSLKPTLLINAAAYTQVDRAEEEPDLAMAINGSAPGQLAQTAHDIGAGFIHYSTDYVFDGKKGGAYLEDDVAGPINIYGKSKLVGEQEIVRVSSAYWIFRTSWLYSLRGQSYVNKVLQWARQNLVLHVVDDQIGNPTWSRMRIWRLLLWNMA